VEYALTRIILDRMHKDRRDPAQLRCAAEIVVFGSYATGLDTSESDIDILCVGNGLRQKSRSLDLSWVSDAAVCERAWLGSELAGHIAKYGVWIKGTGQWRTCVFGGAEAIERKRKRVISLSRTAYRFWDKLHPIFQEQYNITIRRELQRLALLLSGVRIPPTRLLDDEWGDGKHDTLLALRDSIKELGVYEGQANVPTILRLPA